MEPSALKELVAVAQDVLAHEAADAVRLEPAVMQVAAAAYTDPARFEQEREHIFRNLPLMLAMSCELAEPGAFKTMELAGMPLLIVRGRDRVARVFLNTCTHRGALLADGCGKSSRFTCPYHGWTFAAEGQLMGVAQPQIFGEVDKGALGLKAFPTLETAGMIWAVLNVESSIDIRAFLHGYEEFLRAFGFEDWTLVNRRVLKGPNWKLCFDAHLEFYHLPVLHKNSFGPQMDPRSLYYHYGPHQRLARPVRSRPLPPGLDIFDLSEQPAEEWPLESLMFGEWIIFPNISINTFYSGRRGVILSQIIPGATVGESETIQLFLLAGEPAETERAEALETAEFLAHVVGDEDLPTSAGQQKVLCSGALDRVYFGRNEGGLQHFHRWIDRLVDTPIAELPALFPPMRVMQPA
jgi:phenylpropionate dioxygenase-like ring-hydroxylating dioxygenase large terminal subunit